MIRGGNYGSNLLTALSATTATVSSTIAKHLTKKFLDKFEKE